MIFKKIEFNTANKNSYLKHMLITAHLTVISSGISNAHPLELPTHDECVSENIKKAATKQAVNKVRVMCQDKFPQTIKTELNKLSRGWNVNLICTAEHEELFFLKMEPRRKKLIINDTPGELTKITAGKFYGSASLDEGVINVTVSAPTGIFTGTFKSKNGETRELRDMVCTEEQFSHLIPANLPKITLRDL